MFLPAFAALLEMTCDVNVYPDADLLSLWPLQGRLHLVVVEGGELRVFGQQFLIGQRVGEILIGPLAVVGVGSDLGVDDGVLF